MSSASPKPESSVAAIASTRERAARRAAASAAARLCAATAAVPWPMTTTRRIAPARSRARSVVRAASRAEHARRACRRRSTIRPRSVLRNDAGASEISFRRKCGNVAAVDVAGRDLGVLELVARDRERRCRRRRCGSMPSRVPACAASRTTIWPAVADGALGVGRRLAVEPQVRRGLLDEAVRLARDDERVLGEPDVQRLAAAAQREEQPVGRRRRPARAIATRALERGDRRAERLVERRARRRARRDTSAGITLASVVISAGNVQRLERLEVGVVVDVAVERGDDVGRGRRAELLLVERVRVRLGDDADARPPRVPEHDGLGGVGVEREAEQLVVADRGAQHARCCRRARRSRRRPCRRTTSRPSATRTEPERNSGSAARGVEQPRDRRHRRGRGRGRRTSTCSPAESRPRTSSRSSAESATWIER